MDNKKTPYRAKSNSSATKGARPRSQRKADANISVLLGPSHGNTSRITPRRNLNQTMIQNLDMTISGASNPRKKPNVLTPMNDSELEIDLAYNNYLQAIMKQQIVKKIIAKHEEILSDEILIHTEYLHKLETTYGEILNKISQLEKQVQTVEVLNMLQTGTEKINDLCSKYNTVDRLNQLHKVLSEKSNCISTRNIKPINSQEEYDELVNNLNNLSILMKKILHSERNFEEVHKLAEGIRSLNKLKSAVEQSVQKVRELRKKAAVNFLQQASDFFAEQGGYC